MCACGGGTAGGRRWSHHGVRRRRGDAGTFLLTGQIVRPQTGCVPDPAVMRSRLLLLFLSLSCVNGFQMVKLDLRSTANTGLTRSSQQVCKSRMQSSVPDEQHQRRDLLKIMAASAGSMVVSTMWSAFPVPALAYEETKQELVAQANQVVKVPSLEGI